ncbi:hypothetical protein Q3G72_000958 [Acer saccharum]|nr:hypothetical protein Q3G72_000958 [Acer saccharum]
MVMLEGCLDSWVALEKWDRDYLVNVSGNVRFSVGLVEMRLEDYFRYSDQVKEERPLYLFDPKFAQKVPILGSEFEVPVTHSITDVFSASRLIAFCINPTFQSNLLTYAFSIFSQLENPNLFIYNALIQGFSASENPSQSLHFYTQLQSQGLFPDNITFPFLVKACTKLVSVYMGIQVHAQIIKHGLLNDVYVQNSLVHMYATFGDMKAASNIFRRMHRSNVVSWTSMIAGYSKCGDVKSAQGVRANETVMVSVISSCAHLGALELGEKAHEYVERNNLDVNLILGTALVDMYARCGCIEKAIRVFEGLPERDTLSWTSLIAGLALHGYAGMALKYFEEMVNTGLTPRDITFTAILSACSHGGLVEKGLEIFESIKIDYGIQPRLEHYGCVVDLLGRAGKLAEAEKFVLNMPIEPNAPIWGALLGACRIHKNVEIAERAGKSC